MSRLRRVAELLGRGTRQIIVCTCSARQEVESRLAQARLTGFLRTLRYDGYDECCTRLRLTHVAIMVVWRAFFGTIKAASGGSEVHQG